MSWDISVMDLPPDAASVSDIPDDFEPATLGPRHVLIERIREVAPEADFSDPSWGQLVTTDFVIEFNLGADLEVGDFMLHVRGGDGAVPFIARLLDHLGLRAVDCSEGDFFDAETSAASFDSWRDYRDRVVDVPPARRRFGWARRRPRGGVGT